LFEFLDDPVFQVIAVIVLTVVIVLLFAKWENRKP